MTYRTGRLLTEDMDFDLFRSEVFHLFLYEGVYTALSDILQYDLIGNFAKQTKYQQAFYLLALIDYFADVKHIDRLAKYDPLRAKKLPSVWYPGSVFILAHNDPGLLEATADACKKDKLGSYFMKYNIADSSKSFEGAF